MRFWKWEVKKRRGFALLLAVELAILCLLAWNLVRADRSVQTIPYRDIVGTTIPDDRNGWYVDDTFPLADDGLFDMTAEQHMDPGVYEITVNYESDTYDNYTTVGATTKTCNALLADNVKLPGKLTHVTYSVWLLDSTEDFQVKNYYAGSGYLIIRDITIFLNPTEDSYFRLGRSSAPDRADWSSEGKSELMYIESFNGRTRAELRSPDASCNPYLVYALLIHAGLSGIERGLTLPEEHQGEGALLPSSRKEAGMAAMRSSFVKQIVPEEILRVYCGQQ